MCKECGKKACLCDLRRRQEIVPGGMSCPQQLEDSMRGVYTRGSFYSKEDVHDPRSDSAGD